MEGFDVDGCKEIAKRLGAGLKIVTPSWDIITAGNWGGRWDMSVGSMTPTKKRAEVLDFPAVYYYTPAAFAVHKDSEIASLARSEERRVGQECVSTCRSRGSPYDYKKQHIHKTHSGDGEK